MTQLTPQKPVRRETASYSRTRPLIVTLHPGYMEVREKGRWIGYTIDYVAIFHCAAKAKALADRAEKAAANAGTRKGKRAK